MFFSVMALTPDNPTHQYVILTIACRKSIGSCGLPVHLFGRSSGSIRLQYCPLKGKVGAGLARCISM
jgi:hypothetical protein